MNLLPDLTILRRAHEDGALRRNVWVATQHMAADALTKQLDDKEDEVLRRFAWGDWDKVETYAEAPTIFYAIELFGYWIMTNARRSRS